MSSDTKTKILCVITKSNFGGAQRYVFDLTTRLPKEEFEVAVALGGTGEQGAQTGRLNELLQKAGVRTIVLKNASRNIHILGDVFLFFELLRLFRKERPDVIHLNSSKAGGLGALAGRLLVTSSKLQRRVKKFFLRRNLAPSADCLVPSVVFTAHGFAFSENRPFLARYVIRFLSWLTVALSTRTVLITQAEYGRVRHWPFVGHKAVLIQNGIAPIPFLDKTTARERLFQYIQQQDTSSASAYRLAPSAFLIGSIAELHKNKGLKYLIEAVAQIKLQVTSCELRLIIIGEGEERKNLESLIKKHGLEDTTLLAGFVENAGNYLKAFDVFVLPSLKEGLPYVLLEAGMAELPLVATKVGGMPDIVRDGMTGLLVVPADAKELASAISSLCDGEQARLRLGKNAAAAVNASFTVENMIVKTARLYKNVIY